MFSLVFRGRNLKTSMVALTRTIEDQMGGGGGGGGGGSGDASTDVELPV